MNIAQALEIKGEIDSYERQEAAWLLEHLLGINALELKLRLEQELTEIQEQAFLEGLARIEQGEPLAYVTGSQPFWTLDLKVTHDTLVPRPDTEILVETVLKLPLDQHANIVDLGTGTGAIALALASERPQWQVTATDIYAPTLDVAQDNAVRHGLMQVKFACGAWFEALEQQQFDQAEQHLLAAQAKGLLSSQVTPYLAEVKFGKAQYQDTAKLLQSLPQRQSDVVAQLREYWQRAAS